LVSRRGTDSVVALLYFVKDGQVFVGLKKQVRLSKVLRNFEKKEAFFKVKNCLLLEAVAGSLEPNEKNLSKMKKRVKMETLEEAGFDVKIADIFSLGKPFFSSPGQSTEKIYPFAVKVNIENKVKALGDGSLLEKDSGKIKFFPLKMSEKMISQGKIEDAKTEIAIHRLFLKLNLL
jgi:8-oxo-dGTP pyrophosphatase MutT (NUDIX family)